MEDSNCTKKKKNKYIIHLKAADYFQKKRKDTEKRHEWSVNRLTSPEKGKKEEKYNYNVCGGVCVCVYV